MIEDRGNANLGIEADGFEHSLFGQEAGPRKVYQFCGAEPNLDIARLNEALADPIQAPPNLWTESQLWQAYAALEKTKVKGAGGRRILTDLVSLVRFAIHQDNELIPFPERVQANFNAWVEAASRRFNDNNKRQDAASTDGNQRRDAASTEGAASVPIVVGDSLAADPGERFDLILANPPFRMKSGTTIVGEGGKVSKERDTVERDDFWATTSNKQLTNSSGKNLNSRCIAGPEGVSLRDETNSFVQHIKTLLKVNGRAAVVVPDNVLFEGGAGETIRRKLLHECDVHTLLRLPTRLFYAQGVKANVLFFDKKPASETPWTRKLWIYDLRTNMHFTSKTNPLKREDLDDFVNRYFGENRGGGAAPASGNARSARFNRTATWSEGNPGGRWRAYDYEELVNRDKASLDIFWLKDESLEDSENLPPPEVLAQEIVEDLEAALEQFREIAEDLNGAAVENVAG